MGLINLPAASKELFKSNLDAIFETGNLAEGVWNRTLSAFTRDYCRVECAIPTVSNGTGLMALLHIYKENHNRCRVYLQSNTMYGVKTLTQSAGFDISGYVNCNPLTLMPDLKDVEEALSGANNKECAILLLSHIGGTINPWVVEIAEFCRLNNIVFLEDCAHSFGATSGNRHSGSFGDAGVYSFYATKAIPAGEGGIVVTNDREVGTIVENYVKYDRFNRTMNIGVNIRPSEIQALLIYSVAKEVSSIIGNKREIASVYTRACEELSIPFIRQDLPQKSGNYYKFIVLSERGDIAADLPCLATTTSKVYDYCLGETEVITRNHACLPIWYDQPSEITEKVVKELRNSFEKH